STTLEEGVAANSGTGAQPFGFSTPAFAIANYKPTSRRLGDVPNAQPERANFRIFSFPGDENAANAYVATATQVEPLVRDWFGPLTRSATIAELPNAEDT